MGIKRRKRGMGSIFKHGTSWYIAFYDHGKQIKEKVGPVGLITKGQAEEALKARMGEVVQGRFTLEVKKETIFFNELVERYLDYSKVNHRSYKRSVTISRILSRFYTGMKLADISSWLVEKFKIERKNEGKALSNVNRELVVLKRMFNLAIEWGFTDSNPVKSVKFFKVSNQPMRIITVEEFLKLYHAASDHLKPILICAITTGMRAGEIVNLRWKDIDIENERITVKDTKNYDYRIIPINSDLKETLISIYDPINDYVFTYHGSRIERVHKSFTSAIRRAGILKFRFHDLRHTFASNLVMNGVDLVTVQELLGHKSILMTKRYSHPTPEHKKRAVNIIKINSIYNSMANNIKKSKNVINMDK